MHFSKKSTYHITNFILYDNFSPSSSYLITSINSIFTPKTANEDLNHPGWYNAMFEEINALDENHTYDHVDLPKEKKVMECK